MAKQREQYKLGKKGQHSFLTPDRAEKLNSVGFVWQVRSQVPNEDDDDEKAAVTLPSTTTETETISPTPNVTNPSIAPVKTEFPERELETDRFDTQDPDTRTNITNV